jgi:hypothetical protein
MPVCVNYACNSDFLERVTLCTFLHEKEKAVFTIQQHLLLSGYGKKKASLVYIIESDND